MLFESEIIERNHVQIIGQGEQTLVLAHGFGCDQNMWRYLVPFLTQEYKIVLFDYVGSGNSLKSAYDASKYSLLEGFAQDIIYICETLALQNITLVGHSVSSIISSIAAVQRPELFTNIVMICPSPCFLNDPPDYFGGFEKEDLQELMNLMDQNYLGWANHLAPLVMGTNNSEVLTQELADSFCSTDPVIAKNFANATFFSDYRSLLPKISLPVLLLQSQQDTLASLAVGEYMQENIADCQKIVVEAYGHCLHMTHPAIVAQHIEHYLRDNHLE
ncbi:alpha/beta fold hydrolase [Flavobacterium sp. W21_SRS_FM6]|uniref:alpha/beta fold hydrolase n=1 Tax=Flavobacterium sp. W21_SRS_FM6 TaxID=3240268 RepID=UPI003F8E3461